MPAQTAPKISPRSGPAVSLQRTRVALQRSLLCITLWFMAAPAVSAQGFLYAINDFGSLTVNAAVLDKLPSKFDPATFATFEQAWRDVVVDGADRYAIRFDGLVHKNGAALDTLSFQSFSQGVWINIHVLDGNVWALRTDGALARDGFIAQQFDVEPPDPKTQPDYFFQRLVSIGADIFALRSDGAIFRNLELAPIFQFAGGPGVASGGGEGLAVDTVWRDLGVHPITAELYAIRADGAVVHGDPSGARGSPFGGTLDAHLPFPDNLNFFDQATVAANVYSTMDFLTDGLWVAISGRGEVYDAVTLIDSLVDLPGGPQTANNQVYVDILGTDAGYFALRSDGRIYLNDDGLSLANLPKERYRLLRTSLTPPDLSNFKNTRPIVTRTKSVVLLGQPLALPVLSVDPDKLTEDLIVTVDPDSVPPGAVWDAGSRTLIWDTPGPAAKYLLKVTVDDGVGKPVVSKNRLVVKEQDANVNKNRKPVLAKVSKARALVGIPFRLTLLATDLDGDPVSMEVDLEKEPFSLGATFDTKTNTFEWTASLADLGKHKITILLSDGFVIRKQKLKLTVASSLLVF
jgi:hypothetical protein